MPLTDTIILVFTILGSLALFLYGMKLMSESLQRLSGDRLRTIFASIASNPVRAIISGTIVTGIIQSSSAVTVMLVSFVNAGLFTLSQALGIMMGANIGTTVTAWLVTYFGFHLEFSVILLPLAGLSLPLLFLRSTRNKAVGEFILGFVMLFLGLQFMKNALPEVTADSAMVSYISGISDHGTLSLLLFTGIGLGITLLIQSSSATITLTMVMCHNGWISYDAAAAMVLGENIGTTITANIAAIVANRAARRLAVGHSLFNIFGVLWMLAFFSFFTGLSAKAAELMTGFSPYSNAEAVPAGLSVFHSGFNILNTLILAWVIPQFRYILEMIIPLRQNEKKNFRLRYFSPVLMSMSEISMLQAREEILIFGKHVTYMFSLIPEYLIEKRENKYLKLQKRLYKSEEQADDMEEGIRQYLTRTAENDLTESGSRRISSMLKIIDDLESIADECIQMERTITRKNQEKAWFTQEMRDDLNDLFCMINAALENMNDNLSREYRPGILAKSSELELKINELRDQLLLRHNERVEKGEYSYQYASFFSGLVVHCEKLADHIINVNQAIASNVR